MLKKNDIVTEWPSDCVTGSFADDWPYGIFHISIVTITWSPSPGCCLAVMVWKCVAAHVGTILPTVLDWGPLSNNSPSSESACLQIDSPWLAPPPTPRTRAHCPPPQCAWYSVLDTSPFRVCTVLYCTVLHCTVLDTHDCWHLYSEWTLGLSRNLCRPPTTQHNYTASHRTLHQQIRVMRL